MKRKFMFILLISTSLLLVACGTSTEEEAVDPEPNNESSEVESNNDNEATDEAEDTDNEEVKEDEEAQSDEASDNDEKTLMTETGIYNGQADPHTIEIETVDGPTAFQLSMEAREDVEALIEDQEVTYSYYEDGEQLVIESIHLTE